MQLYPVLIVYPKTGSVCGQTNASLANIKARQEAFNEGRCKTVFALYHTLDDPPHRCNIVALDFYLLVEPLEQPNSRK